MNNEYNSIVDRLLDMNPDPIPKFVLLKDFKGLGADSIEYENLYEEVCTHPRVKRFEASQNEHGFWEPFHGYTEGVIRLLLSYGLDKTNPILNKAVTCLENLIQGRCSTGQHEKQDNPLWYPIMFEPLIFASMFVLIDPENALIEKERKIRAAFAEASFSSGEYNNTADIKAQHEYFGFKTKRTIPPFSYYTLLLLAPGNKSYIKDKTDQALVDFCMKKANEIYYVYNNTPHDFVRIDEQNRDSRDFWQWVRALSLISKFKGWAKYEQRYVDWIMAQRNNDGLWEFPKKFDFVLSNSWRNKNKIIDSTIFVLRLLMKKKAF